MCAFRGIDAELETSTVNDVCHGLSNMGFPSSSVINRLHELSNFWAHHEVPAFTISRSNPYIESGREPCQIWRISTLQGSVPGKCWHEFCKFMQIKFHLGGGTCFMRNWLLGWLVFPLIQRKHQLSEMMLNKFHGNSFHSHWLVHRLSLRNHHQRIKEDVEVMLFSNCCAAGLGELLRARCLAVWVPLCTQISCLKRLKSKRFPTSSCFIIVLVFKNTLKS